MLLSQSSSINLIPPSDFSNLSTLSFQNIIGLAINIILIVITIILFFIILGGGISMITSGGRGDSQGAQKGRSAVTGAVIGLIIVFGAWAIISLINHFFGIDIIHLNIP
jgi:hypothetical protein